MRFRFGDFELDDERFQLLRKAGCALADMGEVARAVPILRNAIDLRAHNAQAWVALGSARLMERDFAEAISRLEHGIRISPLDPRRSVWGALLAIALMSDKKLDAARTTAEQACQADDQNYMPRVVLAAIHARTNQEEEAQRAIVEAFRVKEGLSGAEISALVGRRLSGTGTAVSVRTEVS